MENSPENRIMNRIAALTFIFTRFNEIGIEYAVLRNYDFLLQNRDILFPAEKSIDLILSTKSLPLFDAEMAKLGFSTRKPQFSLKHRAYFKIDFPDTISFDVQIGGIYWNDMLYLNDGLILKNRIKKSFFYVLSENDIFVMLLVHSLLGKRYFKPEYREKLTALSSQIDAKYVLERLSAIFGKILAGTLFTLTRNKKFEALLQKKYQYISYFILKSPSHLLTFSCLFFRWLRWKHIFRPSPLISFIGPDGAGKSTLAKTLAEYFQQEGRKAAVIYTGRGREQLLPISVIGRAYKRREKKPGAPIPVHPKIRTLFYMAAAPLFTLDLLLRYLLKIMPLRRRKYVVITDRYCSDIILMPHVPLILKKILLYGFPKPTITFYLYNSPEALHARRPRESIEELSRQLTLFSVLKPYLKPIEVETDKVEANKKKMITAVQKLFYTEWY